jgi:hypothetical protein
MADDIPFANGAGPSPTRRRQYAAPFGALQNDTSIQFGDGQMGPAPREPTNALAMRPIAAPFGMLPTAGLTPEPSPTVHPIVAAMRALLPTLDPMIVDANHYRADQDGQGGGRVADAYNDAANAGLAYTMPASTDPSQTHSPAAWRDYLLDQMKRNRTSNPFAASEADLSAGYPASGLSNDHRFINVLAGKRTFGGPR